MAITPNILLQSVDATPDFGKVLTGLETIDKRRIREEQAPIRNRLLEAQASTAEANVPTDITQFTKQQRAFAASVADISRSIIPDLQTGNIEVAIQKMQQRADKLNIAGIDNSNTLKAIELARTNPEELLRVSRDAVTIDERLNPRTTGQASAKTEILESGASIQALPSGEVVVKNSLGQNVTGQERLDVLEEARVAKVKAQQERADITVSTAKRIEGIKKATNTADKAFGMVDTLRENIANLEQVVPLVGQGAETGPISKFFPSFKAATIKLEQLQKRLSLDVVGAVTFGALSKGELDLAKAVALPLGLDGDPLINWTNDAIAAKKKMANYFEEQAIFLGDGGTQSGWLKFKRKELKTLLNNAGATEDNIKKTMKDNNMSRSEVIQELKRRSPGGR